MTLREVLHAAAAELEAVERAEVGAGEEWRTAGVVFAAAVAGQAEFRLSPVVARAALGTPDTAPSPRGPDWVSFEPPELDRFAVDRATAWFGSAYRLAGGR